MLNARSLASALLTGLAFGVSACKKPAPPADKAAPPSSASAAGEEAGATRCAEVAPGARFSIGVKGKPRQSEEDGDDAISEPFAVEIGGGVALEQGFAVSALESQAGGTSALLAIVAPDGAAGKLVPLGRVQGDVDPPHVARRGRDVFVAVSTHDAKSLVMRLGAVRDAAAAPNVTWGGQVTTERDGSTAFDLAVSGERGVLVFDEVDRKSRHPLVRVVTFDPNNPSTITPPRTVSSIDRDAEMPALATRPSGYWLAWVSSTPKPKRALERKPSRGPSEDAGAPDDDGSRDESVLDMGHRFIELVALDANGSPKSEPKAITPRDQHVLIFDLKPTPAGGAVLAWRDEGATPGVENRTVHLAMVAPDGTVTRSLIDDEQVGAGAPSILVEAGEPALPAWLALESVSDETRLAALGPNGALLDALNRDSTVGNADVLAVNRGRILLSRPRGVAAELSAVVCKPGPKKP